MAGNGAIAAGTMLFRIAPNSAVAPDILERVAFSGRENNLLGEIPFLRSSGSKPTFQALRGKA